MKRTLLILLLITICITSAGCKKCKVNTISDLVQRKNATVFLQEGEAYVPYLVIDHKAGNVLLLRKEILQDLSGISDYTANYEGSRIDMYLSTDYLELFSDRVKELIRTTAVEVTSSTALYQGGKETHMIFRKAFLLSYYEVNYSDHAMAPEEGTRISFFSDDQSRVAYRNGSPCSWWLRTPYTGYDSVTWSVGGDGMKIELTSSMENGIRPAFYVSGDAKIVELRGEGSNNSVFVLE